MKNFSLKALGAIIFAAGLVVAGVAAPASATDMTSGATATATGAVAATGTNAYPITVTATTVSAAIDNGLSRNGSYYVTLPTGWTFVSPGFAQTCDTVGVTVTISPAFTIFSCSKSNSASAYLQIDRDFMGGIPANTTITVVFPANSLNVSSSRAFTVKNTSSLNATPLDTGTATLASAPASYPIGYNRNGGDGGTVTQPSTSSGSLVLPANGFTKTGSTFSGWRVGNASSGTIYQPGETATGITGPTLVYAQWTASSGGGSSASANLSLNATTGQLVAGSSVGVSASGLQSTAAYTVTVESTPQTIGSGNAVSGAVSTNVTLPSGLEAGWHTLTFTSTASDGSSVVSKYYFKVSASGSLLSTSSTIPAELANTGINTASGISLLAGGLSLALVGAELFMIARRKRSN